MAWTPLNPLPKLLFVNMMGTRMQIQPVGTNGFAKKRRPQFTLTTHRERSSREGPILIDTVPLQLFDFQQFLSD
jgi:hypothetical protein